MTSIVSLFLLILAVALVLFLKPKIGALLSWRKNAVFASLYLIGLILMVPVLYLLPLNDFAESISSSNKPLTPFQYDFQDFSKAIAQGDLDKQQGVYKNSQYTFNYDGKTLRFRIPNDTEYRQLFIERKDVQDGKIEVSTYVTTHLTQGIDFTKRVLPPLLSLDNGTIEIKSNKPLNLDFRQFQVDFTVDQFKHINDSSMSTQMGWKAIYIRVPKGMAIDKGNNSIEIIN